MLEAPCPRLLSRAQKQAGHFRIPVTIVRCGGACEFVGEHLFAVGLGHLSLILVIDLALNARWISLQRLARAKDYSIVSYALQWKTTR